MLKFKFFLWAMGQLMKKAAKKNPEFREQLTDKDFAFQIQTNDGKVARHFVVGDDQITSKGSLHKDPKFTISFSSAKMGFNILTSKDKNAFMRGIQEKDVQLHGDVSEVLWFQNIAKHLKPGKKAA